MLRFPDGFLWGVSTSSHQVEGGNDNNNWSAWERTGHIHTGEVAGKACDWWNNAEPDLELARGLGLNALRISVEWSRIEPVRGRFDDEALERYRELVKSIRDRGMRPFVCLHHFTNPLWFEQSGAFLSDDAVMLFERFAERVVDALGDLCTDWLTFNEPNVYVSMGYVLGEFPPGHHGEFGSSLKATLTLLRAHAAAYRVIHRRQSNANVGFTQNLQMFASASDHLADRLMTRFVEATFNDSFLRGLNPGPMRDPLRALFRKVGEAKGTYDFVGFNHYGWMNVSFDKNRRADGFLWMEAPAGMRVGDKGVHASYGGFDPKGLARLSERLAELGKPIYVMEHGIADRDDVLRPWVIARGAAQMHAVIQKGVDLRGYFHWSLVDNFEWAEGWGLRFGLIELDPLTQKRTPRASAGLYRAIARSNALRREDVERYVPHDVQAVYAE